MRNILESFWASNRFKRFSRKGAMVVWNRWRTTGEKYTGEEVMAVVWIKGTNYKDI